MTGIRCLEENALTGRDRMAEKLFAPDRFRIVDLDDARPAHGGIERHLVNAPRVADEMQRSIHMRARVHPEGHLRNGGGSPFS